MSDDNEAIELLTLSFKNTKIKLYDIDEVHNFYQKENQSWSWINNVARNDGNLGQIWTVYNNFFNALNNFIKEYKQVKNNERQIANLKNQLIKHANTAINSGYFIHSSAESHYINELRNEHNEQVAAYALAFLMKAQINFHSRAALEGGFLALQFEKGNEETVKAIRSSLAECKDEWGKKYSAYFDETKLKIQGIEEQIENTKNGYNDLLEQLQHLKTKQEDEFNSLIQEHTDKLMDIEHTYDNKLALQSSVKYWTNKKNSHKLAMIWLGTLTVIFAVATGGGFGWAAYELLKETISQVPLWKLGVMLAISSFGVWLTRLSAKIFISNLHLWTDSNERVTMIQTYLALLREGCGPKDEERQLILQTLFRPSSTGFIQEDGPTGFHETIAKTFTK